MPEPEPAGVPERNAVSNTGKLNEKNERILQETIEQNEDPGIRMPDRIRNFIKRNEFAEGPVSLYFNYIGSASRYFFFFRQRCDCKKGWRKGPFLHEISMMLLMIKPNSILRHISHEHYLICEDCCQRIHISSHRQCDCVTSS